MTLQVPKYPFYLFCHNNLFLSLSSCLIITKIWNDKLQLKQAGFLSSCLGSCLIEAGLQNNRLVTAQADRYFLK